MNDSAGVKVLAAVLGFWLIMRAFNKDSTGRTLANYILGTSGSTSTSTASSTPAAATTPGASPGVGGLSLKSLTALSAGGQTDPIPGAVGSRLDQGLDATSKTFEAPFAGTVVAEENSDAGWAGGGYVAIAQASDPSNVDYFAEGLLPTVRKGQTVTAGQSIAVPERNPYNFILGNIETGPANPKNPLQPLAQVVSNPAAVVDKFYAWMRSLGGPVATSTSGAGHA